MELPRGPTTIPPAWCFVILSTNKQIITDGSFSSPYEHGLYRLFPGYLHTGIGIKMFAMLILVMQNHTAICTHGLNGYFSLQKM